MGLHVGLVGAGRMGAIHARTLAGHPLVSRLSLTDPDRERAAALASAHGAVEADSPESLLEGGAQALVIAAATPTHAPLIRLAAAALPSLQRSRRTPRPARGARGRAVEGGAPTGPRGGDGVTGGLYRPLGRGSVHVAELVRRLEGRGFPGWYVLEQDVMLSGEPEFGDGPVRAVRESLRWLQKLLERPMSRAATRST